MPDSEQLQLGLGYLKTEEREWTCLDNILNTIKKKQSFVLNCTLSVGHIVKHSYSH
jgi:hypothetical protein